MLFPSIVGAFFGGTLFVPPRIFPMFCCQLKVNGLDAEPLVEGPVIFLNQWMKVEGKGT